MFIRIPLNKAWVNFEILIQFWLWSWNQINVIEIEKHKCTKKIAKYLTELFFYDLCLRLNLSKTKKVQK